MKIFVGLGNPGAKFANTKHNVGFMLADKIFAELGANDWRNDFDALIAEGFYNGEKILIVKPQTFMNLSGEAVASIVNFYKIPIENLIVAHDDMDLPVGMIRLRPKGSSGGHRGVDSIIKNLGGERNFPRIRIGIGRPKENFSVNNHVLSNFNVEDTEKIFTAIENLIPATLCIVSEGIDIAMNKFNPKKIKKSEVVDGEI